jgi:four helix bundle protein
VWEKAHRLTLAVYAATVGFPGEELYVLTGEIRRSCSSVPANIAEGCGRDTDADFARFLQISAGSANELEYHLLLARDLGLLEGSKHAALDAEVNDVKRMLATLTRRLRSG